MHRILQPRTLGNLSVFGTQGTKRFSTTRLSRGVQDTSTKQLGTDANCTKTSTMNGDDVHNIIIALSAIAGGGAFAYHAAQDDRNGFSTVAAAGVLGTGVGALGGYCAPVLLPGIVIAGAVYVPYRYSRGKN